MSEGHDMSKPDGGHDATTVAIVLNGDFPSLLEDMDEAEQQLVADELLRHGIGDGKPSFFADIAAFSSAIDDTITNITGDVRTDRMDLVAEIGKQAEAAPEGEMLNLHLTLDGVEFRMMIVRNAGGARAVVKSVCDMLVGESLHQLKLSEQYTREMEVLRLRRKARRVVLCGGRPISASPDLEPPFAQPYCEDSRGRKGDRIARRQEYRAMQNMHNKRGKGRR